MRVVLILCVNFGLLGHAGPNKLPSPLFEVAIHERKLKLSASLS